MILSILFFGSTLCKDVLIGYKILEEYQEIPWPASLLFPKAWSDCYCESFGCECIYGKCKDARSGDVLKNVKIGVVSRLPYMSELKVVQEIVVIGACSFQEAMQLVSERHPLTVGKQMVYDDITFTISVVFFIVCFVILVLSNIFICFGPALGYHIWLILKEFNASMQKKLKERVAQQKLKENGERALREQQAAANQPQPTMSSSTPVSVAEQTTSKTEKK
jgi:hypothetical protein